MRSSCSQGLRRIRESCAIEFGVENLSGNEFFNSQQFSTCQRLQTRSFAISRPEKEIHRNATQPLFAIVKMQQKYYISHFGALSTLAAEFEPATGCSSAVGIEEILV